jgi:hypothetical protein
MWLLGALALLLAVPATCLAAGPDPIALEGRLNDLGLREAGAFARAIVAHAGGRHMEAEIELKAGLLANGVVDPTNARSIAAQITVAAGGMDDATRATVRDFLDKHLSAVATAKAAQEPVLDGFITADAYKALKKAGGLARVADGTGFVYIEVTPSSARIDIDGTEYTGSPVTAEGVKTGYRNVTIRAGSYEPIKGFVLVEPLKVSKLLLKFPPRAGALTVLSEPPGAEVLIDGRPAGKAPLTIDSVPGGERSIYLRAGDLAWSGRVTISGGTELVRATLLPASGVAPPPTAPPEVGGASRPGGASGESQRIDLRGLSPQMREMAWRKLAGKRVGVELPNGATVSVDVGEVRGDKVILAEPGQAGRLVPMADLVAATPMGASASASPVAGGASAAPPAPAETRPAPAPTPAPAPAPAPVATASPAAPSGAEIDLRSLSPSLRVMAWEKLSGKRVEVTLANGGKATVDVGSVDGDTVVLAEPGQSGRKVPMAHLVKVRE